MEKLRKIHLIVVREKGFDEEVYCIGESVWMEYSVKQNISLRLQIFRSSLKDTHTDSYARPQTSIPSEDDIITYYTP